MHLKLYVIQIYTKTLYEIIFNRWAGEVNNKSSSVHRMHLKLYVIQIYTKTLYEIICSIL